MLAATREGTRLANFIATIVLDVCLICICKVFDKMAGRTFNLNFGFKLGGFARHLLGSVWLVGLVKGTGLVGF